MNPRPRAAIAAWAFAPLLLLAVSGCHSSRIAAGALPPEFRAPPGAGMQRMRIQSIASLGGRSAAIGPADVLELTIVSGLAGEDPQPVVARVRDDGAVEAPFIGPVLVAGLEPTAAADQIARAAIERGVYRRPQVQVLIAEQATHRVTVLGAVAEPGVQEVPRTGCDILSAIAVAGGFTEDSGTVVEVLRHGSPTAVAGQPTADTPGVQQASFQAPALANGAPRTDQIDLADVESIPPGRQRLGDRDVVVVRPKEKRVVHVSGLVKNPDQFELTEDHDLRVLDAVAMAGGVSNTVADSAILIRNIEGRPEPVIVSFSLRKAKRDAAENLVLQSGDLISVEQTAATTVVDVFNTIFRVTMGVGGDLSLF